MRDGFADERGESGGIHICDNASHDVSLAANGTDDRSFAGTNTAGSSAATTFIPMPVFGQAANESFIDFDNSAKFSNIFHKSDADL